MREIAPGWRVESPRGNCILQIASISRHLLGRCAPRFNCPTQKTAVAQRGGALVEREPHI